jgi:TonB-linked SusC/RagA family outer membrane protein
MTKMTNVTPKSGKLFILAMLCVGLSANIHAYGAPRMYTPRHVFAQDKKVTGKVTDENGKPLAGASIVVKGLTKGTATDSLGNFTLQVPDKASVLEVSYIGYVSQEVSVKSKSDVAVSLKSDDSKMAEVVVVGYGSQKKSDLTGAISSVKGSDLTKLPTQRVDQALQGRAAGVSVQNTDGEPGGNVTIRIRGGNSITGGNNALVVIDGLQGGDISTLNPNDIQSVEVLKDASATAIYGARGANGVILISTKKGVSGKPVFTYNFSQGTQHILHKLDLLKAGDFARKANAYAATQDGTVTNPIPVVLPFTDAQISALDAGGGTDWQNVIYRNGALQNHQLSASGGSDNARYFVSGGYLDQQGIVVNTKYQRYNLRSNLDLKLTKWLNSGFNINLVKDKGNVPPTGEGTYWVDITGQVINTVARFDPATPVYNSTGDYNYKALKGGPSNSKIYSDPDIWNPLATALETKADKNNLMVDVNAFFDFKLLPGLTFRVTGGASIVNNDASRYYGSKTQVGVGQNGNGDLTHNFSQFYQNSNILTYDRTFKTKHHLTVTGVAEQQLTLYTGTYINASGFSSDNTGINDLGGASIINERYNSDTKQTLNSFLGRVNYGFDNKYLLTASMRADGSSVFGANNKWGYFPSGAFAWKASEEKFIKRLNVFSDLKVRASWGKTGNQAIAPYGTLATVASGFNYGYLGDGSTSIGYTLTRAANPNLKWETTAQTDLGIDFGFLNDRVTATVDVYRKLTTDLLLNKEVPVYTGFTSILSNVGSIENKGLEVSVNFKAVSNRDFRWVTGANIFLNRSKVLALSDGATKLNVITNTGGGYNISRSGVYLKQIRVGEPMDQMIGYITQGTWSSKEAAAAKAYGQAPGDVKFLDVNNDGKITRAIDGQQVIGNASPKFIYGWNNSITYKNFDLNFLIQGSYGNNIFNAVRIKTEGAAMGTSANLNNRWTPDHQNTDVPVFMKTSERMALQLGPNLTTDATGGIDNRWSRWVEDGSYLRLKNITLTYNLPQSLLSKVHITRLAVYATGANLITITKYTGYDPEVSSYNKGSRVRAGGLGIDLSNYPTARSFIFGVNVTF